MIEISSLTIFPLIKIVKLQHLLKVIPLLEIKMYFIKIRELILMITIIYMIVSKIKENQLCK